MTTLTDDTTRLREELAELTPLIAMFASEGWRKLEVRLKEKQQETRSALLVPLKVNDYPSVLALQERYALLTWLVDFLPVDTKEQADIKTDTLRELLAREES